MKIFLVYFENAITGAKSEIDRITVTDDYTPEKYREDCEKNGVEWGNGRISFLQLMSKVMPASRKSK